MGTLEVVCRCLSINKGLTKAITDIYSWLYGIDYSLAGIAGVMIQKAQQQPSTSDTSEVATQLGAIRDMMESLELNLVSYLTTIGALNSNAVALLASHQTLARGFQAVLQAQTNAGGDRGATSSAFDVCVSQMPFIQTPPTAGEAQHPSEEENVEFPSFCRRTARCNLSVPPGQFPSGPVFNIMPPPVSPRTGFVVCATVDLIHLWTFKQAYLP